MKTFIFIPDTNINAGLGHLYRCFKYSNFIKQDRTIIFLINKNFNKKYLVKQNKNKKKIKYIYFSNLENILKLLRLKYKNIIIFLDTYNSKLRKIKFKNYSNKNINILDFKAKCKSDFIIDHTFTRKTDFHKINKGSNINTGIRNFPVLDKINFSKRNLILINFGTVKNRILIKKSLYFLKKLNLNSSYKIVIIDKFFSQIDFVDIKLNNKIIYFKFLTNIDKIYKKTLFAIGGCGIALYERCFLNIPSISKCVANNQFYNFKNFYSKKCILDFDKIIQLDVRKPLVNKNFFNNLTKIENNTKKYFKYEKNTKHLYNFFNKF